MQALQKIPIKTCLVISQNISKRHAKNMLPFLNQYRNCGYITRIHARRYDEDTKKTAKEVPEHIWDVYPDFLPYEKNIERNFLKEKLERKDMLARRKTMDIPEFYVGSIMRVTLSDRNATGKVNVFTGICISREDCGIKSCFTLRNVVERTGVEIKYATYNPLILSIETLKLEKRLDTHLIYLRDCLPEYSTVPMDMEPEPLPLEAPVPVNETQAELKARPWHIKWEHHLLKGIKDRKYQLFEIVRFHRNYKPWMKYDLMRNYWAGVTEGDLAMVYKDLKPNMPMLEAARRKFKRIGRSKTESSPNQ